MIRNDRNTVPAQQSNEAPAAPQGTEPKTYRQPQVIDLGALEQVQGSNIGSVYDGPITRYKRY
jgi:hypothetical protein